MKYSIEKDIPIPSIPGPGAMASEFRNAVESLGVGESILVTDKAAKGVANFANRAARKTKRPRR